MSETRRTRSLFWAIAGTFLLVAVLGTLAQSLVATAVLGPFEARDLRNRAELAVARFEHEVAALPARPDSAVLSELVTRVRHDAELRAPLIYRGTDDLVVSERPDRARAALQTLADGGANQPDGSAGSRNRRYEILASRAVSWDNQPIGEALVLRVIRPGRGPQFFNANAILLSLPIALLTALVAGLVMVRFLVRRLHGLEALATRVAEGDLSARVQDPRGDEIGRVAERLNRMAERLAAARASLEEQDQQRRQLFADITHELATPLTSIRGYTETLLDPRVRVSDEERTRYLRDMLAESSRLGRLIRDLFDLARLEAGAAPLDLERLDWIALCRNVAQRFAPRFEAAGLRLDWRDAPAEAWVQADGHRMEQVLENLLTNALRYVPSGGTVALSMAPATVAKTHSGFRLTVEDDGPGIPEPEIPHLFERFFRSPEARRNDTTRDLDGSGLGLAIVREITTRHGGAVRARPRRPHGLTIEVEIPARS